MANSFFMFKKFKIEQGRCAMKVGTDGVLLGAWACADSASSILDIGTGTGLIALMLAQRSKAENIIGVEIDCDAASQAFENAKESPWANRIEIINKSLQDYALTATKKFDLIVSNPPYFENSLNCPDRKRSAARHNTGLPFCDLLSNAENLLEINGRLCVVLPTIEGEKFTDLAKDRKLYLTKKTKVFPKPNSEAKRLLLEFSKRESKTKEDSLQIESETRGIYTPEFTKLVKEFYLKL